MTTGDTEYMGEPQAQMQKRRWSRSLTNGQCSPRASSMSTSCAVVLNSPSPTSKADFVFAIRSSWRSSSPSSPCNIRVHRHRLCRVVFLISPRSRCHRRRRAAAGAVVHSYSPCSRRHLHRVAVVIVVIFVMKLWPLSSLVTAAFVALSSSKWSS